MLPRALIWIKSAANRIRSGAHDREYARTDPLKLWHSAAEQAVVDRQKNDPAKPRDRSASRRVLTADRPAPRRRLGGGAIVLQRRWGGAPPQSPLVDIAPADEAVRLTVAQCCFNMTVSFVSRVALISNGTSPVRSPALTTTTYLPSPNSSD